MLMSEVEKKYQISLSLQEIEGTRTVSDIRTLIRERKQ
jgi:acyl carrier protein